MNKLPPEDRIRILHLLCEGISIRGITRRTGASKNTVAKLLSDAGKACATYHDANVLNLKAKRIQIDEIWSFTSAKQHNLWTAQAEAEGARGTWTWTAIDADSKLIVSCLVGDRDAEYALWLIDDLRARLASRVELTTGGHGAYLQVVEGAFGSDVDYAQLVEMYGPAISAPDRSNPSECIGLRKRTVDGRLDDVRVSPSHHERTHVTTPMHIRPLIRPTNKFSKKVESHAHAVALHMMYYNFVRIPEPLRVTPAMAAGVTDRLWEIEDIAKLV